MDNGGLALIEFLFRLKKTANSAFQEYNALCPEKPISRMTFFKGAKNCQFVYSGFFPRPISFYWWGFPTTIRPLKPISYHSGVIYETGLFVFSRSLDTLWKSGQFGFHMTFHHRTHNVALRSRKPSWRPGKCVSNELEQPEGVGHLNPSIPKRSLCRGGLVHYWIPPANKTADSDPYCHQLTLEIWIGYNYHPRYVRLESLLMVALSWPNVCDRFMCVWA